MFKQSELKKLEDLYAESGNQLVVLYGQMDCEKEALIRAFVETKKHFYYRARKASAKEQLTMMGEEIARKFETKIQKESYDEYFNRVKSGNPTKLVIVIDEFEHIVKKDLEFMESILKLKNHRLYPGPVMIILASSSILIFKLSIGRRILFNINLTVTMTKATPNIPSAIYITT